MPLRLLVHELSQAAEARRAASALAVHIGFSETRAAEVAIAVSEAGSNLVRYATNGELLLNVFTDMRGPALEMLTIDHGPGMDVQICMEDGYSSAGTMGTGLGAIRRLARDFDIWSDAQGSVLFARFRSEERVPMPLQTGTASAPKPGETACGDNSAVRETEHGYAILVCDGLGHGPFAAEAANLGVATFDGLPWRGARDAADAIHGALRGTRGAAIAIADVNVTTRRIAYCGLGNISGSIHSGGSAEHMVSHAGTAGHQAVRISEFEYTLREGSFLVMHTDGIGTRWNLDVYPRLWMSSPGVVAGLLYRDHCRGRDDATVVVAGLR